MPFKSKAQMEKIAMLEKEGKVKKGTYEEFKKATKNFDKLPEHAKNFLQNHEQRILAEAQVLDKELRALAGAEPPTIGRALAAAANAAPPTLPAHEGEDE